MIIHDELIFWFETPPKVSKGAFNYVSKNWGKDVFYICNYDYPDYRKRVNWNDGDFGEATVLILQNMTNTDVIIDNMFKEHPNAIHVLSGFNNSIEKRIRKYALSGKYKIVVFSERPVEMGGSFIRLLRLIYFEFKYRYFHHLYSRVVRAFLPLGSLGVSTFAKYGWSRDIMYPFMYNPESHALDRNDIKPFHDNNIHFLYVGRFYYKTKGVDILMRAAENLSGQWHLDMVGGYGTKAEEVKSWIDSQLNVDFLGSWPSNEVSKMMSRYDVVVVPSKYDGWNLLVNEAINSSIGVITTDKAVSDEVIKTSGAGIVVPANNVKALTEAMQYVIDCPNIILEWRKRAALFAPRISPEVVGTYFIKIMNYSFYNVLEKPECPWLDNDNV